MWNWLRIAGVTLAGLATLMVAAAQTSPQDAKTNIASWYNELLNLDPPHWLNLPFVDTWVSWIGLLVLVVAICMIAFPRQIRDWRAAAALWLQLHELQWPITKRPLAAHLGQDDHATASTQSSPDPVPAHRQSLADTAEERAAKHAIATFIADHIIPTYEAQIALQVAIITTICGPNNTVISGLAWSAHQGSENMRQYGEHIQLLTKALDGGISTIPLAQLIESVKALSKLHHALCSFPRWLAGREFDYKSAETTAGLHQQWRMRQSALVEAFQPFKKDLRLPKLYDLSGRRSLGEGFETDA